MQASRPVTVCLPSINTGSRTTWAIIPEAAAQLSAFLPPPLGILGRKPDRGDPGRRAAQVEPDPARELAFETGVGKARGR